MKIEEMFINHGKFNYRIFINSSWWKAERQHVNTGYKNHLWEDFPQEKLPKQVAIAAVDFWSSREQKNNDS